MSDRNATLDSAVSMLIGEVLALLWVSVLHLPMWCLAAGGLGVVLWRLWQMRGDA